MQTIKTYFENKEPRIRAQIVGFDNIGWNQETIVYSNPLTIFSGVNNPIKIQCLNSDQKRVDVSNVSIQAGLFEPNTENELVTQTAANIDSANGIVEVFYTANDLAGLDFGYYEIALRAIDSGGNVFPIYINDHSGSRLTTKLSKGPILAYADALPLDFVDVTGVGVVSNQIDLTNRPINSTVATMSCNLQSYSGNLIGQATLVSTPTNTDWANVSVTNYSNQSGFIFQNLVGSFAWGRFLLADADPSGNGNVSVSGFVSDGNIRV
jgi:hypothetical protein